MKWLPCLPDKCERRAFCQFYGDPVRHHPPSPWRAPSSTQPMQQTCHRAVQSRHEATDVLGHKVIINVGAENCMNGGVHWSLQGVLFSLLWFFSGCHNDLTNDLKINGDHLKENIKGPLSSWTLTWLAPLWVLVLVFRGARPLRTPLTPL